MLPTGDCLLSSLPTSSLPLTPSSANCYPTKRWQVLRTLSGCHLATLDCLLLPHASRLLLPAFFTANCLLATAYFFLTPHASRCPTAHWRLATAHSRLAPHASRLLLPTAIRPNADRSYGRCQVAIWQLSTAYFFLTPHASPLLLPTGDWQLPTHPFRLMPHAFFCPLPTSSSYSLIIRNIAC